MGLFVQEYHTSSSAIGIKINQSINQSILISNGMRNKGIAFSLVFQNKIMCNTFFCTTSNCFNCVCVQLSPVLLAILYSIGYNEFIPTGITCVRQESLVQYTKLLIQKLPALSVAGDRFTSKNQANMQIKNKNVRL